MGQLREEAATKNAEVLELRGRNEVVTLERDILQMELASPRNLLQSAKKEIVALLASKPAAKENASLNKKDTATAN